MRTIYIDVLFVVNFIINYIILMTSSKFGGFTAKRRRISIGACIGAVYSVIVFFPKMSFLYAVWIKIFFAFLITAAAFGFKSLKALVRRTLVFFIVSLIFGGGLFMLEMVCSDKINFSNGIPYIDISLKTLIIFSLAGYAIIGVAFRGSGKRAERCIKNVQIEFQGRCVKLRTLVDTGCELCDPISGRPVIICTGSAISELFSKEMQNRLFNKSRSADAACILENLMRCRGGERFRIIPFKTVGKKSEFMISFRPDRVISDNGRKMDVLIGISSSEFSESCGYSALVSDRCR